MTGERRTAFRWPDGGVAQTQQPADSVRDDLAATVRAALEPAHMPGWLAGNRSGRSPPRANAPDFSRLISSPQAEQNDSTASQTATAASGSGVRAQRSSTTRTIRAGVRRCTYCSRSRMSNSASIPDSA